MNMERPDGIDSNCASAKAQHAAVRTPTDRSSPPAHAQAFERDDHQRFGNPCCFR